MNNVHSSDNSHLGYPTPKIEWQKADARPLSSGYIRQVVMFFPSSAVLSLTKICFLQGSQLQSLLTLLMQDSGIYKCLGL